MRSKKPEVLGGSTSGSTNNVLSPKFFYHTLDETGDSGNARPTLLLVHTACSSTSDWAELTPLLPIFDSFFCWKHVEDMIFSVQK